MSAYDGGYKDSWFDTTPLQDWLYSSWDESKYQTYKFLNMIPGVHQLMDYYLDVRADQEYFDRYQMDYTDIHDPRKLSQTSSAASVGGYAQIMFSKNIHRLYGD